MGERRPLVEDVVGWTVTAPPPASAPRRAVRNAARAGAMAGAVGLGVVLAGVGLTPSQGIVEDVVRTFGPRPRMPRRARARMPLSPLAARGTAPWLPGPLAQPVEVVLWSHAAVYESLRAPFGPTDLPLAALTIASARPATVGDPFDPDTPWTLRLTGEGVDVTVSGPWLSLAWFGHLAGWPQPSPTALSAPRPSGPQDRAPRPGDPGPALDGRTLPSPPDTPGPDSPTE